MKKLTIKQRRYWPLLVRKRFYQSCKRRKKIKIIEGGGVKHGEGSEYVVIAPAYLDMYKPKNHTNFIHFKQDLEKQAKAVANSGSNAFLRICFRNTTHITAAAGLLMIATVDNIKIQHQDVKFKVTRPPSRRQGAESLNLVDSVLDHIGFYKLIGHEHIKRRCTAKSVTCWSYAHGDNASGEIAAKLITNLASYGIKTNKLYRSCLEAVANACEHAYTDKIVPVTPFKLKRWWFFVGVLNDKITVLICDLGHGIPNTLEVTQDETLLTKLWKKLHLSSKPSEDCTLIQASTMVKETRTKEIYRGKGGADVKTFVDETENSSLIIFSNKGTYRYAGKDKQSRAYDNSLSAGGTIIEWIIPYTDMEKQ